MFNWVPAYQAFEISSTLITLLIVLSVSTLFECGIFSLAVGGFVAIGGYSAGVLTTKTSATPALGMMLGTVLSAGVALVLGLVVFRLKGIYLALGTFAFAQLVLLLASNWELTGSVNGIYGIPPGLGLGGLVLAVVALCIVLQLLRASYRGRAIRAIRLSERTAEALGVHVARYRLVLFALCGGLAGFAGACNAQLVGVISADQYGFSLLVTVFAFALVGGTGHWLGPVLATVFFTVLQQVLGYSGSQWEQFAYGVAVILVVALAPNGISESTPWRWTAARLGKRRPARRASLPLELHSPLGRDT